MDENWEYSFKFKYFTFKEELQKLQVLCKSCHIIKTRKDLSSLKFFGTLNPRAKLKFSEVIEIRNKYSSGNYTYNQLAAEYKVSKTNIINIVYKHTRKYR